jgi:hypothetical protein
MSNLQNLLDQLREWSGEQPENAGRVATILMGLFAPAANLKTADVPAHPAATRDWLVRTITAFAHDGRWPDPPVVSIQADRLVRFLPLVLTHTEPADWPTSPSLRRFRAALAHSKTSEGTTQAFLDDPHFRKFLGQFGGFSVAAPDWGKYRAQYTVRGTWRWPLAVVVDDHLLAHPQVRRARKAFDTLGLVRLVAHGDNTRGAIRLAGGASGAVLRSLEWHDKEAYAYVLGTGRLEKTGDLQRITNKAASGGAAMLDWPDAAVPRELVKAMVRLHREAGGYETFDAWLRHAREGNPAVLYAHQDALALTAPEHAARVLGDAMSVQYDRAIDMHQELPSLGILAGRQQLVDVRERLRASWMPPQLPATAQWLRDIGTLTGALRAADALGPMPETRVGESLPQGHTGAGGGYSERANRVAIPGIEYIGGIGGIGGSGDIAVAPQYPRARQVRTQASLTSNGEPLSRLRAGSANVLRVQLASESLLDVVADTPFSVEDLPSDDESLELDLTLLPLAGVAPELRGIALRQPCRFSKQLGASPVCEFALAPAPGAAEYRARLLVRYENRVLQSLMVRIPGQQAPDAASFHMEVENLVRTDLSQVAAGRPYDLSIVANHDETAQSGMVMMTKTRVEFREPKSFPKKLQAVSEQLKMLNASAGVSASAKLRHAQLTHSLNELANLGYDMRDALCGGNPDLESLTMDSLDPMAPTRIQVVEAVPEAFLPVEIFYDGPAPVPNAALCAKVGLDTYPAGTCAGCADRKRADLICPSRFWGLSKVIERRPFVKNAVSSGEDHAVSLPGPHRARVPDLQDIVYGVSGRFTRREGTAIKTSLKKLGARVHATGGWEAWRRAVAAHGPQMLVAIGHLQPGHAAVDMLEIGNDHLRCTNVCAEHIRKHPDDIPIVLLLGCGTLYTEDQLGSFVRHFSRHGAGLVVATIASMFTAQAHLCVDSIAQAFDRARTAGWDERQAGHHTAGFAVLRAKQALMTAGSGLALALTGAGDGEWEF